MASRYPYFTEEHEMFRKTVRDFVQKELAPHAEEWDKAEEFPREVFVRMGELGFLGIRYPEEYGGSGLDYFYSVVFAEELANCGLAGLVKSRFIFIQSCIRNIDRINALSTPRLWQCFRPGMLIFLAVVIPTGAWMSRAATGHHALLCWVGALDVSIGVALLLSSRAFWKPGVFR